MPTTAAMKALPQNYDTKETEKRWQNAWEEQKVYQWDQSASRERTYVIDTPPPTVSGALHMGHVFSYTQADFIARFQRMAGKTVFYPMGFDDNGLPTERLVEKVKKVNAHKYIQEHGREGFVELCEGVAEEARSEFRALFKSIALSVDWEQEYHTISDETRLISQMSFLDLFHKGEVERKYQPMLWDPVDLTAIAQAEVEDKEMESHFNDIHFGIEGSDEKIVIATTRPELLPACVAVFYHPDDARYQHLKGKQAVTPLFGVKVPIMEDDTVEPEKGTGIMMCCTFGDEADIEKWRKHKLPTRVILNQYGKLAFRKVSYTGEGSDIVDEHYRSAKNGFIVDKEHEATNLLQGLKTKAARAKVIELLEVSGDLIDSKPIVHAVKCAERSGAPLEIIPTYQWFVKVMDKKDALKAKAAECDWYPKFMQVRMDQWTDGLSMDWCISRQRYFGMPFPVWYAWEITLEEKQIDGLDVSLPRKTDVETHIIISSKDELPVDPLRSLPAGYIQVFPHKEQSERLIKEFKESGSKIPLDYERASGVTVLFNDRGDLELKPYYLAEKDGKLWQIEPETDVMDTWATSSVSPQLSSRAITQDYAEDYERHQKLFPADLRPQAHEIIRTWAFYTVVKAHLHEDSIPWKNLMISGWCLASDKTKMSKSKGNVVTPIDLIENKGADVVRYWASTSKLGTDTAFSEDVLKIGKKLVNKLWNATKFAAIHLDKLDGEPGKAVDDVAITEPLDRWILTRLHRAIAKATKEFTVYEYADARAAIEDFFWNDFCDNYLELVKVRAYGNAGDVAAQKSAVHTIYHCLDGILRLFAPIVPHVTEELFSHIFEGKGSLHAQGMWPDADAYPCDEAAEAAGIDCVALLEAVRKQKSERNVSIKYPIDELAIAGEETPLLEGMFVDLAGASNAAEVKWGEVSGADSERLGVSETENANYKLQLLFAIASDVA